MTDPYQILGVERTATEEQIKKAYRKLAKAHHPDVNKEPGAEARFKEIQTAFETIGDPQKRQNYDRFGTVEASRTTHSQDFSDVFNSFFSRTRYVEAGAIVITLEECVSGCKKEFTLSTNSRCPSCRGTGAAESTVCQHCGGRGTRNVRQGPFSIQTGCQPCGGRGSILLKACNQCGGHGQVVSNTETLSLDIPPGSLTGTRLLIKRTQNEELFVTILIKSHPIFETDDYNLYLERDIHFSQLVLGAVIEVPTITGIAEVTVAPGTNPRSSLRLRGEGIPNPRNNFERGDIIIGLNLVVPNNLQEEQRRLYESLRILESQQK
jgi:molecular chaperone DnaJ